LGNGSVTPSPLPVDVTGLSSGVVAIAVGEQHSCAVTEAGKIMCWGMNGSDMLGSNVGHLSLVPVEVPF
jgi:alpha-tubulin suppressor-like RCC1 family protein